MVSTTLRTRRTILLVALPLALLFTLGVLAAPVAAVQSPFELDRQFAQPSLVTTIDWIDVNPGIDEPDLIAIGRRSDPVTIVPIDGLIVGQDQVSILEADAITLPDTLGARQVAWAREGANLLLGVARDAAPDQVFRITYSVVFDPITNDPTVTLTATEIWRAPTNAPSTSMAWADYNNDGAVDLLVGAAPGGVSLFTAGGALPGGRTYTLSQTIIPAAQVRSLSYTRYTSAGGTPVTTDLLAVGVFGATPADRSAVYTLDTGGIVATPIWQASVAAPTTAAAWGDADGNGTPDLFLAGYGDASSVYRSTDTAGIFALNTAPAWVSLTKERTLAIAVGDVDGDGRADLFSLNYAEDAQQQPFTSGRLRRSSLVNTIFQLVADEWTTYPGLAEPGQTLGAAILFDYSREETPANLDLLIANPGARTSPSTPPFASLDFYRNLRVKPLQIVITDAARRGIPGALVFRQAPGQATHLPYRDPATGRLLTTDASGRLFVRGDLRAGDSLIAVAPALADTTTITRAATGLPLALPDTAVVTSTLTIPDTGSIRDLRIERLQINHSFLGDLQVTLISPAGTRVVLLDRACGRNGPLDLSIGDDEAAQVCPLTPGARAAPAQPLSSFVGEEINGAWRLEIADGAPRDAGDLLGWQLVARVADAPLYYTNAVVNTDGSVTPTYTAVNVLSPQFVAVSEQNPLLLFKLDVALEWDARNDEAFLQQLRFDLQRAAELLYDFTDGQATVLQYTIFHDRERWSSADVRISASNRLRPNADQGGVTATAFSDPNNDNLIYTAGQVRMGALWSRYGAAVGTLGEDWPRALAHELGHYLLYLDDNYLGLERDAQGNLSLIGIPQPNSLPCRGVMFDPYRDEESEFHPDDGGQWLARCGLSLSQFSTRRSDWATISTFYPALRAPQTYNANPGPVTLPFALPIISEQPLSDPPATLQQNTFTTVLTRELRLVPSAGSRAILYRANQAIDLGSPLLDQIEARGAHAGDELCVYDRVRSQIGCTVVSAATSRVPMVNVPNWRPDIRVIPVSDTQIRVELLAAGSGLNGERVEALFYPTDQRAFFRVDLLRNGAVYERVIDVTGRTTPIQQGIVRVIVAEPNRDPNDNPLPRREAVVDYVQHGVASPPAQPVTQTSLIDDPQIQRRCGRPPLLPCGESGAKPGKGAPASTDGQAAIYGATDALIPGDFFTFQAASALRGPLPPWSEPVGTGYWLDGTAGIDARLSATWYNAAYLERELPPGTEGGLAIFFRPGAGQAWERLALTRSDPVRNEVSARARGRGLYALMTTLAPREGWNLLSYPWPQEGSVADAFARLNADARHYTTVYGYNDATRSWSVYDNQVPAEWAGLVNKLAGLKYGRGYWVNVTAAGAGGSAAPPSGTAATGAGAARPASGVPTPPATYYGELLPGAGVTPVAGLSVEALIGGKVCGTAETVVHNGKIAFVVQVEADRADFNACGSESRVITWRVGGAILPNVTVWDNTRPFYLALNGGTRIWLPQVGLKVPAPSPCVVQC
jgi:subtilisin-like proprotein convertase family protein